MDDVQGIVDNILTSSITDCSNYQNKNYSDCIRCVCFAGVDNLGELICCKEIERAREQS